MSYYDEGYIDRQEDDISDLKVMQHRLIRELACALSLLETRTPTTQTSLDFIAKNRKFISELMQLPDVPQQTEKD